MRLAIPIAIAFTTLLAIGSPASADEGAEPGAATPRALAAKLKAAFDTNDLDAMRALHDPAAATPELCEPFVGLLRMHHDFAGRWDLAVRRFGDEAGRQLLKAARKLLKSRLELERLATDGELATDSTGRSKLAVDAAAGALRGSAIPVVQRDGRWYLDTAGPWSPERSRLHMPTIAALTDAGHALNRSVSALLADPALDAAGFLVGVEAAGKTLTDTIAEINRRAKELERAGSGSAGSGSGAEPGGGSGSGTAGGS